MLKADFEATVEMGMAKTSCVIWASIGNLVELTFHQFKNIKISIQFFNILHQIMIYL
jgi:hypothetical protein